MSKKNLSRRLGTRTGIEFSLATLIIARTGHLVDICKRVGSDFFES